MPPEDARPAALLPRIDPEDELVCLGHDEDLEAQGGALAPPIVQTSLFAQPTLEDLSRGLAAEHENAVYSRGQNPTVAAVEAKIARLERGEACKCFASGMAAISALMLSQLKAGDHLLFVNQTYGPALQLAQRLRRFGIEHDCVLDLELAAIEGALRPETRLIWLESPGTMTFRTFDLAAVADLARERGILTAHDNSWATPLFQKPLTAGVDFVVHSATKYLAGHSDVVAGALVGSAERMERLFYDAFLLQGGILAPFDAWLLNRGLRTLPVRLRQHHAGALAVARHLAESDPVRQVFHPGLADPPADLQGYSGLFSFELAEAGAERIHAFVDALRRFRIGVSWGGVESLVLAPNRDHSPATLDALAAAGIPAGTVRLSVGLEDPALLIADLDQALEAR